MSKQTFDNELFSQSVPEPDTQTKKQIINAAQAEFRQAFKQSTRPNRTGDIKSGFSIIQILRRLFMKPMKIHPAFAIVTTGFLIVSLFMVYPLDWQSPVSHSARKGTANVSESGVIEEVVVTGQRHLERAGQATSLVENYSATGSGQDVVARNIQSDVIPIEKPVSQPSIRVETKSSVAGSQPAAVRTRAIDNSVVAPAPSRPDSNEEYAEYQTNKIIQVSEQPVSTFSADVDTASYALVRNQLKNGFLPNPQAVRAEEFINYFNYDYPLPANKKQPFKATVSVLDSPWNASRKLLHIGIKGYDIAPTEQPDSNLVFLLDVSGSMNQANKLPLVKQSMGLLLESLKPTDTVSIAVYAGAAGTVLEPTKVANKAKILQALNNLRAGGSTAGGQGIRLAYQLAEQNFSKTGINRIILATDGDFNVGQSSNEALKTLVERKRDSGVMLSVLGFGRNNYKDDLMQTLAQNGNGVAAYIDTLNEAKKVLLDEATANLFPIAKDVKLQLEFNPQTVADYRLIGYETRALNREDFNNDKVDAGDIGAGHTVTAIYEITPQDASQKSVDDLRYQAEKPANDDKSSEYGLLKIRYKLPEESKSNLIETIIPVANNKTNNETGFAVAVAGFAQLLANSPNTGSLAYDNVINLAQANKGRDEFGYRAEFIQLVRLAKIAQP